MCTSGNNLFYHLLCSRFSWFDLFSMTNDSLLICDKFAGVNGGKVFNCSLKDWLANFLICWIKFGLFVNVFIRSNSDGLLANSRKCSIAFCGSVFILMGIFVGLVKQSFDDDDDNGDSNFKFLNCKFISSKFVWLSCKFCSKRRSVFVDCRWKDFFIFEWCWLWCNDGRFILFDDDIDDEFDSDIDVEKKFIVCGGIGKDKFVVVVVEIVWSSCLVIEDDDDVTDDELDIDDDDVVRFFFPVVVVVVEEEEGGDGLELT